MYVCGPTVYNVAHVGHGRTYLYFDVLRRFLQEEGVAVRHVMNITDFEDKVTARAQALGISWRVLARREERAFRADLRRLRILDPHLEPRASDFVPQMIKAGQALERRGELYHDEGEWCFRPRERHDPRNFPIGSELAKHAVPEPGLKIPAITDVVGEFTVWREQEPPNPAWPSPWGRGAPGWHLECYSMARSLLQIPVDVHGGGSDLIFPHHYAENEVALNLDNSLFSRQFLHTAFVTENGQKMSKSTGNLVPLAHALHEVGPDALRCYLLSLPYNTRLSWDPRALDVSAGRFRELRSQVRRSLAAGASGSLSLTELKKERAAIFRAVGTGFRVDAALDRLFAWSKRVAAARSPQFSAGERAGARREYASVERLLGLALT